MYKISDADANPAPQPPCIVRDLQESLSDSFIPYKHGSYRKAFSLDHQRKVIMRAVELEEEQAKSQMAKVTQEPKQEENDDLSEDSDDEE